MTPACPHAGGGLLICSPCVQRMVEPPKRREPPQRSGPRRKNPKAWRLVAADGSTLGFYERVSKSIARRAYRKAHGKHAPAGSRWEGVV